MHRRCAGMPEVMLSRERQPGAGTGRKNPSKGRQAKSDRTYLIVATTVMIPLDSSSAGARLR
jgi:hypothetical protein